MVYIYRSMCVLWGGGDVTAGIPRRVSLPVVFGMFLVGERISSLNQWDLEVKVYWCFFF